MFEKNISQRLLRAKKKSEREKARDDQEKRSKKYGIGVKNGGNITKPSEYKDVSDSQFSDPSNYR